MKQRKSISIQLRQSSKTTHKTQRKAHRTIRPTRLTEQEQPVKRKKTENQVEKVQDSKPDRENYYVTNAMLLPELKKWQESADKLEDRMPSNELGLMFMKIAQKISNHYMFRGYTKEMKEDMQGYAVEKMLTSGLKNYNFKFTNAFAYFSQACFNAFKTQLSKHYKQVNIKRALTKKAMVDLNTYMPKSSMEKCLENQFTNNEYDDFSEF